MLKYIPGKENITGRQATTLIKTWAREEGIPALDLENSLCKLHVCLNKYAPWYGNKGTQSSIAAAGSTIGAIDLTESDGEDGEEERVPFTLLMAQRGGRV